MKCQRKPKPEEKKVYSISANSPVAYEPDLSHSSHGSFFHCSAIDAYPVTYELDLNSTFVKYTVSAHLGLPEKMDLTMKIPEAYLRCTGRCSRSSEIQN